MKGFRAYIYKEHPEHSEHGHGLAVACVVTLVMAMISALTALGAGFVPVRNFTKNVYHGGPQNWAMIQDSIGRVYIGNRDGMLAFDGMRWNIYPLPNYTAVRSLYFDVSTDRIYAGGSDEFGYFEPDKKTGQLIYHSLMPLFGKTHPGFSEIWNILPTNKGIWFQSDNQLFGYDGSRLTTIHAAGRISRSAVIDGHVIVAIDDGRMQYLSDRGLKMMPNTAPLVGKKITGILPAPVKRGCIIVTSVDGLYLYDGTSAHPLETEISGFLKENQVFSATSRNDVYVFGTVNRGAVIYSIKSGKAKYVNKKSGMQNNTVLGIGIDMSGNIWLCLDNGIDYAFYNSPVTDLIGRGNDIGAGYMSLRNGANVYFGTNQGLYSTPYPFKDTPDPLPTKRELHGQVWGIARDGDRIVVAGDAGLFTGGQGAFTRIGEIRGAYKFETLPGSATLALASTYDRFHLLRRRGPGNWVDLGPLSGYDDIGGDFKIDNEGYIWLSHFRKGIYRLHIDTLGRKFDDVQLFDMELGLPDNHNNAVEIYEGRPVFSTIDGFYTYDSGKGRIVRDVALQKDLGNRAGSKMVNLLDGLMLLVKNGLSVVKRRTDGRYDADTSSYVTHENLLIPGYENINYISEHELVVSNQEGFWNLDTRFEKKRSADPAPFVNAIYANRDSLVYRALPVAGEIRAPKMPFDLNSLVFDFGYTDFSSSECVEFSSYLESYDKEWTAFTSESKREYTRLGEGDYILHIKARDVRTGTVSETSFPFKVLPPWYRSTAANLVYTLLFLLLAEGIYLLLRRWVARAQHKIEERKEAEMETLRKESEREALKKDYEIATLKSDQLEVDIRHKSSELSNTTMNLIRKNQMLTDIDTRLSKLQESLGDTSDRETIRKQLSRIKTLINDNISHDDDWKRFTENFDVVYVDFTKRLMERHPNLSPADKRLCCYIKMGLSSKEIAPLVNISYKSVEMARYRLRKKMDLPSETNLTDYLSTI